MDLRPDHRRILPRLLGDHLAPRRVLRMEPLPAGGRRCAARSPRKAGITFPERVLGRTYGPIRGPTKAHLSVVCRIEQRSLISLLNAAKTARGLIIAAESLFLGRADGEITAKTVADPGCCPM